MSSWRKISGGIRYRRLRLHRSSIYRRRRCRHSKPTMTALARRTTCTRLLSHCRRHRLHRQSLRMLSLWMQRQLSIFLILFLQHFGVQAQRRALILQQRQPLRQLHLKHLLSLQLRVRARFLRLLLVSTMLPVRSLSLLLLLQPLQWTLQLPP